jgi:hypothetical protein
MRVCEFETLITDSLYIWQILSIICILKLGKEISDLAGCYLVTSSVWSMTSIQAVFIRDKDGIASISKYTRTDGSNYVEFVEMLVTKSFL